MHDPFLFTFLKKTFKFNFLPDPPATPPEEGDVLFELPFIPVDPPPSPPPTPLSTPPSPPSIKTLTLRGVLGAGEEEVIAA